MNMTRQKPLDQMIEESDLSPKEIQFLLKAKKKDVTKVRHYFSPKHTRFGLISDTHIGVKEFDEQLFFKAMRYFKRESVDAIYHCGDHLEGMSGRPGHIYELDDIGFEAQMRHAIDLYSEAPTMIYGIDGNHDQWYEKKNNGGAVVGQSLEERCKNYTNLGQDEADIKLAPNVVMKLFHPGDGSAYAISYKLQKLIESFTGGDKPNIVAEGHYHKALYMFSRNVHGIEAGTLCGQTKWMRGKKIPAHMGFWMVDAYTNKKGVDRIEPTFVPAYD